jgi:hypothetical protein
MTVTAAATADHYVTELTDKREENRRAAFMGECLGHLGSEIAVG